MSQNLKLKVLLTDGKKTVEIAWIKHTGTEVYLGPIIELPIDGNKRDFHFSYHWTGARNAPVASAIMPLQPLSRISGHVALLTIWVDRDSIHSKHFREYKGLISENTFLVDLSEIPASGANIFMGLLEPGKEGAMQSRPDYEVKQRILLKSVTPWISISVECRKVNTFS